MTARKMRVSVAFVPHTGRVSGLRKSNTWYIVRFVGHRPAKDDWHMAIDATLERPQAQGGLRLVALNGAILESVGGSPANGETTQRPLSEVEAYDQVITAAVSARRRLDPSSDAWRELGYLLVELERSAYAAREQNG